MIAAAWIIAGLAALIAGAELIVRGGTRVAGQLGVPPMIIGLTIVSVGTSAPELAIGIEAALRDNGALAVGNIAGTNTVNLLLIFGLSALLRPLALRSRTLRFDLPTMAIVALAFLLMAIDGELTRLEGGAMTTAAVAYTFLIVLISRRESRSVKKVYADEYSKPALLGRAAQVILSSAALILGIAVVVVGSDWLVDGAVTLARTMDVSDALIGLTIVAIGTSSPELVTTIVGTLRNDREIAIGNLLGSSIYNILAILGLTCLVPSDPLPVERSLVLIDIPIMTAATLACVPVFLSGRRVSRIEGGSFVTVYAAYLLYLVLVRT